VVIVLPMRTVNPHPLTGEVSRPLVSRMLYLLLTVQRYGAPGRRRRERHG